MSRRPRAAKEVGAHSVAIDSEGLIRIQLTENTASNKLKRDIDESWLVLRHCNGTSSEPKANEIRSERRSHLLQFQ